MATVAHHERHSMSSVPRPLRFDRVGQSSSSPSSPSPLSSSSSLRRQSSISYKPSDSEATFAPRSPAPGAVVAAAAPRPESSRRHSSYISGAATNGIHGKNRDAAGKDRPLTLVEKHADLLIFIAQKESKCLELRTQLAAHEQELMQLKKKWEQIMLRGGSQYTTTPSMPPSNAVSAYPDSSASSPMLQGIKEGVRLLAAATSLAAPPTPISPMASSSPSSSQNATLSRASQRRPTSMYGSMRHVQNDSASTSTSTSRSVDTTRFSLSSQSSLGWEDAAGSNSGNNGQELIVPEAEYPGEETPTADMIDGSEPSSLRVQSASTARVSFDLREDAQSGLVRRRSRGRGTESSTSSNTSGDTTGPVKSASSADRNSAPAGGASSWIDSVGKKWGELSNISATNSNSSGTSSTLSRSQKRATTIFSDLASAFGAIPSAAQQQQQPAASGGLTSKKQQQQRPALSMSSTLSTLAPPPAALSSNGLSRSPSSQNVASQLSILDDDDDVVRSGAILSPALTPSPVSATVSPKILAPAPAYSTTISGKTASSSPSTSPSTSSLQQQDDEDEWNW